MTNANAQIYNWNLVSTKKARVPSARVFEHALVRTVIESGCSLSRIPISQLRGSNDGNEQDTAVPENSRD